MDNLEILLPSVSAAISKYNGPCKLEVCVVDNGVDANVRDYIEKNFQIYKYIPAPENHFLFSLNDIIKYNSAEYTFLLNDDTKLDPDILNHLIPTINDDQKIFAVTCKVLEWDSTKIRSTVRVIRPGLGWFYHQYIDRDEGKLCFTLFPNGNGSIFRTELFNSIGGFDRLYYPAYGEDTDIGIRAWQNNWKVVFNPHAILNHKEGASMASYAKQDKVAQLITRNHILWMLKNIRQPRFLFWFFILYPYRLVYSRINNYNQFLALINAVPLMAAAIRKRSNIRPAVKDADWMKKINTPYIKET